MRSADPTNRRFAAVLATISVAGLVGRVIFAAAWGFHADGTLSDAMNYHLLGQHLAEGLGYIRAFDWAISHVKVPTAEFRPSSRCSWPASTWPACRPCTARRSALAALGTVTVVLVGLLGREVAGQTAAEARGRRAWRPPTRCSCSPTPPCRPRASTGSWSASSSCSRCAGGAAGIPGAGSGPSSAVVGLAALTRSEALLLLPLVVLWATRSWRSLLLATVGAVVVLSPWVIRNAYALGELVPLSDNRGTLLVGANCRQSWQGPRQGLWTFACVDAIKSPNRDEIPLTHRYIKAGTDYARAHLSDAPRVGAVCRIPAHLRPLGAARQQRSRGGGGGPQRRPPS